MQESFLRHTQLKLATDDFFVRNNHLYEKVLRAEQSEKEALKMVRMRRTVDA